MVNMKLERESESVGESERGWRESRGESERERERESEREIERYCCSVFGSTAHTTVCLLNIILLLGATVYRM